MKNSNSKCSRPCIFFPWLFSFCRWKGIVWDLVWEYSMHLCSSNSPTVPIEHVLSSWQAWTALELKFSRWCGLGAFEKERTSKLLRVEFPDKETEKQQRLLFLIWCFHGLREFSSWRMDTSNICTSKRILQKCEQVSQTCSSIFHAPSRPNNEPLVHFSVKANMKSVKKST